MRQILTLVIVSIVFAVVAAPVATAQQINQPKHIPNNLLNKVTSVRLRGLTLESEIRDQVDEELQGAGIDDFVRQDCSLNIGNTNDVSRTASVDRDVVIVGDVVNFCRR